MKRILFLFLFVFVSGIAFADMTIIQKIASGPMMGQPARNDVMTMRIKGSKARIDFESGETSQIVDVQAGKMYVLDHSKKQVMVMTTDMMRQTGEMFSKMGGGQSMNMNFQKTNKTQTINGYKCDEYTMTTSGPMSMTATYWITNDIDDKEFKPFKEFGESFMKMMGATNAPEGMPIRSETKMTMMGKNITSSAEVQKISHDALSDTLFDLPKDYSVSEMPDMMQPHK